MLQELYEQYKDTFSKSDHKLIYSIFCETKNSFSISLQKNFLHTQASVLPRFQDFGKK